MFITFALITIQNDFSLSMFHLCFYQRRNRHGYSNFKPILTYPPAISDSVAPYPLVPPPQQIGFLLLLGITKMWTGKAGIELSGLYCVSQAPAASKAEGQHHYSH